MKKFKFIFLLSIILVIGCEEDNNDYLNSDANVTEDCSGCANDEGYLKYLAMINEGVGCQPCANCAHLALALCFLPCDPGKQQDIDYNREILMQYYENDGFIPCPELVAGTTGGGGNENSGEVFFYLNADCGCGNVQVNIDGSSAGIISNYYTTGDPSCGSEGGLTKTLTIGSHSFTATCGDMTWSNSFTIVDGGCSEMLLTCGKDKQQNISNNSVIIIKKLSNE